MTHRPFLLTFALAVHATIPLTACSPTGSPVPMGPERGEARESGRALVRFVDVGRTEAVWLDEALAPWPMVEGDRDPGVRRLVRGEFGTQREVLYEAPSAERLLDAAKHPSGELTTIGIDADRRPFVVRLSRDGAELRRWTVDDPELAADTNAWIGDLPPDALRVGILSGDGARIAAHGEAVVIAVMTDDHAVIAYRFAWNGTDFVRGPRTLVTPAAHITPFLPIGASYDDFDAIVNWFVVHLDIDAFGRAYVANFMNSGRIARHNAVFGTSFVARKTDADRTNRPSDFLLSRVDADGTIAFSVIGGAFDVDDETYGVRAGSDSVAVVGRARRYRGLDNTEWDLQLSVFGMDGTERASQTYDGLDSMIGQTVAFTDDGSVLVGGTEAWHQNPDGFSLFDEGQPFLLRFAAGSFERLPELLPATRGHAELRDIRIADGAVFLLGLENGPLTHTGDADPSLIVADGFASFAPLP